MANENYSDVVQALAQQIVSICIQTLRQNFQGMLNGAVIKADQIDGAVSSVNPSGIDWSGAEISVSNVRGLNEYVAQMIRASDIDISQIARLDPETGKLFLDNVQVGTAQVYDLEARFADIWRAQVGYAEIEQAVIDRLQVNLADIVYAQIQTAKIDSVQIRDLQAAAAKIAQAEIDNATIGYAQIEGLTAGQALIQQGVGGKLYIADLAVTEANMVSLTVGQLVVKGQDGGYYQVTVTEDEHGNKTLSAVDPMEITGDNIQDYTIDGGSKIAQHSISGADKLIAGSVTARELNVEQIFANSAQVLKLIAQNISVSDLFANTAFINELNTRIIKAAGEAAESAAQIYLADDRIISTVTSSQAFQDKVDQNVPVNILLTLDSYTFQGDDKSADPSIQQRFQTQIVAMRGSTIIPATVNKDAIEPKMNLFEYTVDTTSTATNAGMSPIVTVILYAGLAPRLTEPGIIRIPVAADGKTFYKDVAYSVALKGSSHAILDYRIRYQLSDSGTTVPEGEWQEEIPRSDELRYLWTRTEVEYADGTTVTSYSVAYQGADGLDARGVEETKVTYAASTDGKNAPATGWTEEVPDVDAGQYLWTRTTIYYTDGSEPLHTYSVALHGQSGSDALIIRLTSSNGTLFKTATASTTLTAQVFYGVNQLTADEIKAIGILKWYKGGTEIRAARGQTTLTVTGADVDGSAVYEARLEG